MLHLATKIIDGEQFEIGIAETQTEKGEVYHFRYDRFIKERGIYDPSELSSEHRKKQIETDKHDIHADIIMVKYNGEIVATVRSLSFEKSTLIMDDERMGNRNFVFPEKIFSETNKNPTYKNTIEASRWAAYKVVLESDTIVLTSVLAVYGLVLVCIEQEKRFIISDIDAQALKMFEIMGWEYNDLLGERIMYRHVPVKRILAKVPNNLTFFNFST